MLDRFLPWLKRFLITAIKEIFIYLLLLIACILTAALSIIGGTYLFFVGF